MTVLALSGGVGGAKLAAGLAQRLGAQLTVCCNTGDDMRHLGLHISPDIDSVLYALGGLADGGRGWGRSDESWAFMDALGALGGETWFKLGDRDLALHVLRSARLAAGEPLSAVTAAIAERLGITASVAPMSDDAVATFVQTRDGALAFQHYFVREACRPAVSAFEYRGAEQAQPSPPVARALADSALRAIVLCPSNPYVSLGPILAIPAIDEALRRRRVPAVAVSPIIAGRALKGPADKMMRELGVEPRAAAVAALLRPYIDGFVVDRDDEALLPEIRALGVEPLCVPTIMRDDADRLGLADAVLRFAAGLAARGRH